MYDPCTSCDFVDLVPGEVVVFTGMSGAVWAIDRHAPKAVLANAHAGAEYVDPGAGYATILGAAANPPVAFYMEHNVAAGTFEVGTAYLPYYSNAVEMAWPATSLLPGESLELGTCDGGGWAAHGLVIEFFNCTPNKTKRV